MKKLMMLLLIFGFVVLGQAANDKNKIFFTNTAKYKDLSGVIKLTAFEVTFFKKGVFDRMILLSEDGSVFIWGDTFEVSFSPIDPKVGAFKTKEKTKVEVGATYEISRSGSNLVITKK